MGQSVKPLLPRPIHPDDNVKGFVSGIDEIDTWLATQALKSQRVGDARTYVSIDSDTGNIAGFYSLAAWGVARTSIKGWLARNAPQLVPVILIGRLATSLDARGIGLGRSLLVDAKRKAELSSQTVGARALVAEALDDTAGSFYIHNGFTLVPETTNLYAFSLRTP